MTTQSSILNAFMQSYSKAHATSPAAVRLSTTFRAPRATLTELYIITYNQFQGALSESPDYNLTGFETYDSTNIYPFELSGTKPKHSSITHPVCSRSDLNAVRPTLEMRKTRSIPVPEKWHQSFRPLESFFSFSIYSAFGMLVA